jgi:hypothetical protein
MPRSTLPGRAALCAILVTGCLTPAAIAQSPHVYVPPSPDTATRQGERWLQTHPAPQDVIDPHKTANVYVPPAQGVSSALDSLPPAQTIAHAAAPSADGGASPWTVIGLALGCTALLGGVCLALVHRTRRTRRSVA